MSPEVEMHLNALPFSEDGRKVFFNQVDLQVHKAWARMFIKAGLVPVSLLQRGSQNLPTRAYRIGEIPTDQQ